MIFYWFYVANYRTQKKGHEKFIDIFFWDFYESFFYVKITSEVQHKKWIYSSSVCPVI